MSVSKLFIRVLGLLATIILQIAAAFLVILLFSVMFGGVDNVSRPGWLLLLFIIWAGYVIGINLIGQAAIRWVWTDFRLLGRQRLVGTMIGAAIPLIILIPIGYSVPVGDEGSRFYDLVTIQWQPILAQASLFAGLVGFYIMDILSRKKRLTPD